MKINHQLNVQNVQNVLKTYGKNVKQTENVEKSSFVNDKVEISSEAREIQIARKALSEVPDVRSEKVEALKGQIASGNYKPSAEDIVDKLLSGIGSKI